MILFYHFLYRYITLLTNVLEWQRKQEYTSDRKCAPNPQINNNNFTIANNNTVESIKTEFAGNAMLNHSKSNRILCAMNRSSDITKSLPAKRNQINHRLLMIAPQREQLTNVDNCRIVKTEIVSSNETTNPVASVIDHKKSLTKTLSSTLNSSNSDCINRSTTKLCRADLLSIKVEPNMLASSEASRFFINSTACFDKLSSGCCDGKTTEDRNGSEFKFSTGNRKANKFFIDKLQSKTATKAPKSVLSIGKRKTNSDRDCLLSDRKKMK